LSSEQFRIIILIGTGSEENMKAAAQIAIWEVIFDSTFNLGSGNFYTSAYTTNAYAIWNAIQSLGIPTISNEWALAVSPTITGGPVPVAAPQNYLVRYTQVPEPTSLLLFGLGLLGLAGVGRKKK